MNEWSFLFWTCRKKTNKKTIFNLYMSEKELEEAYSILPHLQLIITN